MTGNVGSAVQDRGARRLVVVPTDPIAEYELKGMEGMEAYFNPGGMFAEVYVLSPRESGRRCAHGMTIIGVEEGEFGDALHRLRPHVVRAYGGFWPSDLVTTNRVPGVPIVVSVHDTNPDLLHASVTLADLVLCVSKAVMECVRRKGVDPRRIRLLPNRVDLEVFGPARGPDLVRRLAERFPPGRHILLVGRLDRQKNQDTLIRALSLLPEEYMAILVGRGDRAPYVAVAEQEGVAERCYWVDHVPNSELALWYSWCDCMCTPSRWEGFGVVFIEAAACGAAIVTSDIAPMNEFLSDGVNACLVKEYEDPRAVASAIRRVCEDETYRHKLSRGALEVARSFDRQAVDCVEMAAYAEALQMRAWPTSWLRLSRVAHLARRAAALPSRATRRMRRLLSVQGDRRRSRH